MNLSRNRRAMQIKLHESDIKISQIHLENARENLSRLMTRLGGFVTLYRNVHILQCYRGLFKVPREIDVIVLTT